MNNQQNDDMDRQTLNVAFATQKGGSGKTAITVLVAGYLHYRLGCPLAVIDCDFPQYSLYEMRERDSRAVLENEYLKRAAYEQMRQPGRAAYPVRKCRVEQAPRHGKGAGGGRLLRPALLRPAGHGELGGHPAHDRTDGLHLRPGECGQGGAGKHALLPRRAATDDAGQGDEPLEGALPFLEPSGQAGNERAVREVRAGGRRHGAADAANPHPRHETLPQGGGRHRTDGVPLHAAGSRQADAGRQRHPRTDP